MPAGRPKITTNDFPKDWAKTVIEMMSEGASQEEVQGYLVISDKTLTRLCKEDETFFRTIKEGRLKSRLWWEQKGRKNLENKDFSATLWYMNMKNRFGWRDRHDHTTNNKDLPTPLLHGISSNDSSPETD